MKKNGFVSTTLIYTFFVIFLLLMIFLLNSYSRVRYLSDEYKYEIKKSMQETSLRDLNLYVMVWNTKTKEYELKDDIPTDKSFEAKKSFCTNGAKVNCNNANCTISNAKKKDSCFALFK